MPAIARSAKSPSVCAITPPTCAAPLAERSGDGGRLLSRDLRPAKEAAERLALTAKAGIDLSAPLEACRRLDRLQRAASTSRRPMQFAADFGRQFEYYSGFVFQIEMPGRGIAGQIAGGGRYDGSARLASAPANGMLRPSARRSTRSGCWPRGGSA